MSFVAQRVVGIEQPSAATIPDRDEVGQGTIGPSGWMRTSQPRPRVHHQPKGPSLGTISARHLTCCHAPESLAEDREPRITMGGDNGVASRRILPSCPLQIAGC